jgi:putative heme-binding domain-containing protein
LSAVAARYGRHDLLDSIVLPSKVVDGKYRETRIETDDGRIFSGQVAGCDLESLAIAENPSRPTDLTRVPRSSIVARRTSPLSIMPVGLLNTLSREEILDLLAYLESAGKE